MPNPDTSASPVSAFCRGGEHARCGGQVLTWPVKGNRLAPCECPDCLEAGDRKHTAPRR